MMLFTLTRRCSRFTPSASAEGCLISLRSVSSLSCTAESMMTSVTELLVYLSASLKRREDEDEDEDEDKTRRWTFALR
jgi:hypothetical protein